MKPNSLRLCTAIVLTSFSLSINAQLIELKSESHFTELCNEGKPMVLDFYANWCGVCKRVKPDVEQLAKVHTDINFILINGDKHGGLKNRYDVRAYPSFVFLDNTGKEVDRGIGRNLEAMKRSIQKLKASKPKPIEKKTEKPGLAERILGPEKPAEKPGLAERILGPEKPAEKPGLAERIVGPEKIRLSIERAAAD